MPTVICANCKQPMRLDPIGKGFSPRCPCSPNVEKMRDALRLAEKEADVAYEAIWSAGVTSAQMLHDHDCPASASSAIERLRVAVSAALRGVGGVLGG